MLTTKFSGLDDDEKRAVLRRILDAQAAGGALSANAVGSPAVWANDLVLEEDIDPTGVRPSSGAPRVVLLTGATGYLGAFVLHDLCKNTELTIHCLVRAPDPEAGLHRIASNLERYGLWRDALRSRIVAVVGDLSRPKLGLGDDAFRRLGATVDAIYHIGAAVNFLFTYEDMRDVNIGGTKEILRLAAVERLKPLHFASTFGVFLSPHYTGKLVREAEIPQTPPPGGYGETKWVTERLVHRARRRGFPVSIYRPPFVGWNTSSGVFNDKDFVVRLLLGSLAIGKAPDVPLHFHVTPVEIVSESIVQIASNPESIGQNHNLVFSNGFAWRDLVHSVEGHGSALSLTAYDEWRATIQLSPEADGNPARSLLSVLPERLGEGPRTYADILLASQLPSGFENTNAMRFTQEREESHISLSDYVRPFLERVAGQKRGALAYV